MRVLHIINSLSGGGRERRMVQLVYGLSLYNKIQQDVLVFSNKNDYYKEKKEGVTIHLIEDSSKIKRFIKYLHLFKKLKPNVAHIWLETPFDLLIVPILCIFFKTKCVTGFVADGNKYPFFSVKNIVSWICFRLSDAVVSNSKAGLLAKRVPDNNKAYVIYNGFDFSRFENIDCKKFRDKENITSKFVVTMCGRFTTAKDWKMFVNLAAMLQDKDITFLAVGDGNTFNEISHEVKELRLDNIRLLGRRSDVENILSASDISVLFSNNNKHKEGVSNSILEAMAAGKPVIATRGGGTGEIVEEGVNGFLVEPGDTTGAYKALASLLENEDMRMEMGHNANKHIRTKFLLSDMTKNYIDLYSKIV